MLMNTWQFHFFELIKGGSHVGHLFLLCLQWITYLKIPKATQVKTYLLLQFFLVTSVLISVCLYGWSNSSVPFIHLTIRAVSGIRWYWEAERGNLGALNHWGDLYWRGDLRPLFILWPIIWAWIFIKYCRVLSWKSKKIQKRSKRLCQSKR